MAPLPDKTKYLPLSARRGRDTERGFPAHRPTCPPTVTRRHPAPRRMRNPASRADLGHPSYRRRPVSRRSPSKPNCAKRDPKRPNVARPTRRLQSRRQPTPRHGTVPPLPRRERLTQHQSLPRRERDTQHQSLPRRGRDTERGCFPRPAPRATPTTKKSR